MPPPIVSTSAFVKTVNGRSPVSGAVVVTAGDVGLGTGDDVGFRSATLTASSSIRSSATYGLVIHSTDNTQSMSLSESKLYTSLNLDARATSGYAIFGSDAAATVGLFNSGTLRLALTTDGRTLLGPTLPTDAGYTLDVNGDTRVNGAMTVGSYTVGTLPTATAAKTVYCSNARNVGELMGAGTGSLVTADGTNWKIPGIPGAVAA